MNTPTFLQVISIFLMRCAMVAKPSLHSKLNHFEILTPSHMKVRVKRSSSNGQVTSKHVSFFGMGRNFNLDLIPGSPVIAPEDFEASAVDDKGNVEKVDLDLNAFYFGTMKDNPETIVDASYVDGVWSAQIQASEDHYFIEPLSKLDNFGPKDAMILYRNKDVNMINISDYSFNTISFGKSDNITFRTENWSRFGDRLPFWGNNNRRTRNQTTKSRHKRDSTFPYLYCDVLAVVDTYGFRGFGKSSLHKTASMIIYWYQLANRIFTTTDFGNFYGVGLRLRGLKILKNFSSPRQHFHYNAESSDGVTDFTTLVIYSMTTESEFSKYCITHMTSQRKQAGSVLGLTVIANNPYRLDKPKSDFWTGGICAANYHMALNVGFSTVSYEGTGSASPDAVYLVILTHELGHSWGADHDDEDPNLYIPECSPTEENGGVYLMHSHVNSARSKNNYRFSPCSRLSIDLVLLAKAHLCFYPARNVRGFCGNGVLDSDEICDEGIGETNGCCTDKCRLRPGAVCSRTSSPCCSVDCQVAPPTQKCYSDDRIHCYEQAYCDGKEYATCPPPKSRPNGERCEAHGTCWQGRCLTYCENKARISDPPVQLRDCPCEGGTSDLCSICCRRSGSKHCKPMDHDSFLDDHPCLYGVCKKGICIREGNLNLREVHLGLIQIRSMEKQKWLKYLVFYVQVIITPIYAIFAGTIFYLDFMEDRVRRELIRPQRASIRIFQSERNSRLQ